MRVGRQGESDGVRPTASSEGVKNIESSWSGDVRAGSVVDSKRAGSMGISMRGIIVLCAWVCQRVSWGSESKRRNPLRSIMSLAKLHQKG